MASKIKLVIGDKNYSSWSMRPWLALKASKLPFEEIKVLLDRPDTKKNILKHSPSGKVPVLIYKGEAVWDSLAICEFIAELAPKSQLWPKDDMARAQARSYVAEMHSGFLSLRTQMSMDIRLNIKMGHLLQSTVDDIKRITSMWESALQKYGGPYLFGSHFGIADSFYAPVVMRFNSYGVQLKSSTLKKYMNTMLENPFVNEWIKEAKKEEFYQVTIA